jgi:hypothetical protein
MKAIKWIFLGLVMAATVVPRSAWAAQVNVADTSSFGTDVGPDQPGTIVTNGIDSFTVHENTYCSTAGCTGAGNIYTYVYTVTVTNGFPGLSQFTLGSVGYDTGNYGVVTTGPAGSTTPGVAATFVVNNTVTGSTIVNPTTGGSAGLASGDTLVFYLQSDHPPFGITINGHDGGTGANGLTLGPTTPEPTSMALLGSGIALMGGFLRKHLKPAQ